MGVAGTRVAIVGATGMIGGLVLKRALADRRTKAVTTIGRTATGLRDDKLTEKVHVDFSNCEALIPTLAGHDVVFYCLGAYTGAASDADFKRITVDYTIAFARAVYHANRRACFCFLSGQGADSSERSRIAFARYKGMAENGLQTVGLERVHMFRPGYIYPVSPRAEPNVSYVLLRKIYPLLRRLYPNIGVSSEALSTVMWHVGLHGTPGHVSAVLENRDIRALASMIPEG